MDKGFSLIELMIVVAIIGILSMISLPLYNNYIVRIETTRVITDLSRIFTELNIEAGTGDYGTSQYSADNLLALAPNTAYELPEPYCMSAGVRLYRIKWTDPNEIAKVLNNHTSKVKELDIQTYKKDSTCLAPDSQANVSLFHESFFFTMDYEAYGVNNNVTTSPGNLNPNGMIVMFLGGNVQYYNKNLQLERTISNPMGRSCGIWNAATKPVNLALYPRICHYDLKTRGVGTTVQRMLYAF